MRNAHGERFVKPLGAWHGGRDAQQRAALITAYLLGLATLSAVLRNPALGRANVESVVRKVAPVLQRYIDPD